MTMTMHDLSSRQMHAAISFSECRVSRSSPLSTVRENVQQNKDEIVTDILLSHLFYGADHVAILGQQSSFHRAWLSTSTRGPFDVD